MQIFGIPQSYASERQLSALTNSKQPIRSVSEMRALVASATAQPQTDRKPANLPVRGSTSPAVRAGKERANATRAEYLRLLNSQAEGEAFRARHGKQ